MNNASTPAKVKKIGTKSEVYQGLAQKTKGGLVKDGIHFNEKKKSYVSAKKHTDGLKNAGRLKIYRDKKSSEAKARKEAMPKPAAAPEVIEVKSG